jgi:hypothetical protein
MSTYNRPSRSQDILDRVNDREYSAALQDKRFSSHLNPLSSMSDYNRRSRSKDILDRYNDEEHSTTVQDKRSSSHLNVDTKRTRNNDGLTLALNGHEPLKQRTVSSDSDSQLKNSSHDVPAYDTLDLLSNSRFSSGTQSLSRRSHSAISLNRASLGRQSENPRPMPVPRRAGSASK